MKNYWVGGKAGLILWHSFKTSTFHRTTKNWKEEDNIADQREQTKTQGRWNKVSKKNQMVLTVNTAPSWMATQEHRARHLTAHNPSNIEHDLFSFHILQNTLGLASRSLQPIKAVFTEIIVRKSLLIITIAILLQVTNLNPSSWVSFISTTQKWGVMQSVLNDFLTCWEEGKKKKKKRQITPGSAWAPRTTQQKLPATAGTPPFPNSSLSVGTTELRDGEALQRPKIPTCQHAHFEILQISISCSLVPILTWSCITIP